MPEDPPKAPLPERRAHRLSYGRRSAAERANSTIKDPASNNIVRGWCRLMGLVPMTLMLACFLVVRNQRVLDSFEARAADDERRAAQRPAQDAAQATQDHLRPRRRRRQRAAMTAPAHVARGYLVI